MSLRIVEGIASVWHYHLSESGRGGRPALCGETRVMPTSIPVANWMDRRPSHVPASYCRDCESVRAMLIPGDSNPSNHQQEQT